MSRTCSSMAISIGTSARLQALFPTLTMPPDIVFLVGFIFSFFGLVLYGIAIPPLAEETLDWGNYIVLSMQGEDGLSENQQLGYAVWTFLGNEMMYTVLTLTLWIAASPRLGTMYAFLTLGGAWVALIFKLAIGGPRPYWVDPSIIAYSCSGEMGMPSLHAWNSLVMWMPLTLWVHNVINHAIPNLPLRIGLQTMAWCGYILTVIMVSLSRIALGVHYPHQILWGIAMGGVWGFGVAVVVPHLLPFLRGVTSSSTLIQTLFFTGCNVVACLIAWAVYAASADVPAAWISTAAIHCLGEGEDPARHDSFYTALGVSSALWAICMGHVLMTRVFLPDVKFWEFAWYMRILNLVLCFGVVLGVLEGLGAAIDKHGDRAVVGLLRYILRYGLTIVFTLVLFGLYKFYSALGCFGERDSPSDAPRDGIEMSEFDFDDVEVAGLDDEECAK